MQTVEPKRRSVHFGAIEGHELSMALRRAYMRLHRDTCAKCAEFGLTADQYVIMNIIKSVGTAIQSELVLLSDSDPNTVSAMLRRLQKIGFIERQIQPTDQRAKSVRLTVEGEKLLEAIEKKTSTNRNDMESVYSKSELEQLISLLRRLATYEQ